MPTGKRITHLRKEGAIHFSSEVGMVASLIAAFLMLKALWGGLLDSMKQVLVLCFKAIEYVGETPDPVQLRNGFFKLVFLTAPSLLILLGVVATIATLAIMLQTNWNLRERKVKFNWNMLNPLAGIKRIVSINGAVSTLKSIFKLALILPIGYIGLKNFAPQMLMLMHSTIPNVMQFTGVAIWALFWKVVYVLAAMAIFDYFWGKYQWLKVNKMTKDEVEDERKSVEGDEETRRRIMLKGLQRVMQRIKSGVRQADVVITNPTHYAVALKYDRFNMDAPMVVAKGMDFMALRIRELAGEAGVPIVEKRELARALYSSVEVGKQIPHELFRAVAEVLAYVYRIKNPNWRNTTAQGAAQ